MSRPLAVTDSQRLVLRNLVAERARAGSRTKADQAGAPIRFLVTGATSFDDNRWRYTLAEARRDVDTFLYEIVTDGLVVTAYNINEDGNTADIVAPGHLFATLPSGWECFAVSYARSGERVHRPVVAWWAGKDSEGDDYWEFDAENVVDGPCPDSSESG